MKNFNSNSTPALSRFAKDKRLRTTKTKDERREMGEGRGNERPKRASFNPNFTDDNHPKRSVENGKRRAGNGKSFRQEPKDGFKPKGKGFNGGIKSEGGRKFDSSKGKGAGYKGKSKPAAERNYPKYNPNKVTGEIRLNRFVAQSGLCSRREADNYIEAGLITVNGVVVTELGTKITPGDDVRFNSERVNPERKVYVLLNKPKDCVTTVDDPQERKTVLDCLRGIGKERIYPVGRLDRNTTGVLLLTNDGDLASKLTHPKFMKKKVYHVTCDKNVAMSDMDLLVNGIELEDGNVYADEVTYVNEADRSQIGIEIHSGKNRIVRRMMEHLGYKVQKLDRVLFAGLTKKNLKRGDWRYLTEKEVNMLRMGAYE